VSVSRPNAELVRTPEERINLTSSQGISCSWVWRFERPSLPCCSAPFGYRGMALIMAGLAIVSFYSPVLGVNEKKLLRGGAVVAGVERIRSWRL